MANINTESSLMVAPEVNFPRYLHQYTVEHQTTFNLGDIVPIYINTLVMPGETIRMNVRQFYKLTTSLFPAMGTLHADIYAFCDNYQNLWDHSKEFYGEDLDNPQEVAPEYTVPQVVIKPTDKVDQDDLLHRLACPYMEPNQERSDIKFERLSYNHYCNMYNWYFRDQNYIAKIPFSKGDEDINKSDLHVQKLLKAARKHDFFMGTPKPQKGEPELLPIGTEAPVVGTDQAIMLTDTKNIAPLGRGAINNTENALRVGPNNKTGKPGTPETTWLGLNNNTLTGLAKENSGIVTDLTQTLGASINALRLTATMQQIKEMLLFYGGRINEVIRTQYGVTVPEGIIQQTEFLGSAHCELNMDTVLQTSESSAESPLGDSAGYSTTFSEDYLFEKSFTYWSVLSVVVVVRQKHTYCQGLALQHQKKRKYDFFNPMFKGLGAQPRPKSIIYLSGTETDNDVWNFAPAWQEYKFELDRTTGLMAPNVPNNLAVYNYTDLYENVPNSGKEWINETPVYLDRTLAVQSTTTPQFISNFQFDIERINTVPNFILPGIDKI
jgi:hypothetical protein